MLYMDSECVMAGIEVKKRHVGGPCTYTTLDCREFGVKGDTWGERLGNIRGIMVPRSLFWLWICFSRNPLGPLGFLGPHGLLDSYFPGDSHLDLGSHAGPDAKTRVRAGAPWIRTLD